MVLRRVRAALHRELGPPGLIRDPEVVAYPGTVALAYRLRDQRVAGAGAAPVAVPVAVEEQLLQIVEEARASAARAASGCAGWRVDLAPPAGHLADSLDRAVRSLPATSTPAEVALTAWSTEERRAFEGGCSLLGELWPEMLAEVAAMVRQVVLLDGEGIDGFTDARVHGAVFLHRRRVAAGGPVPAEMRLAEALVHEGGHTRCNAAALAGPPLTTGDDGPLLATPLRRDPRPLWGLLNQVVVLLRCLDLHDRAVAAGRAGAGGAERRETLRRQAGEAVEAVLPLSDRLTEDGRALVAGAEAALG